MGIPSVFDIGRSAMNAAKAAMSTTSHNIANANTEGYTRQRVEFATKKPQEGYGKNVYGRGTKVADVARINDQYLEKHLRNATGEMAYFDEKEMSFKQVEDIFNELDGEGLNRLMSKFYNQFRQLASDPDNEAIRQSVRESALSVTRDFHRLREQVHEVRQHIDNRLEADVKKLNSLTQELTELNGKIREFEAGGATPNDHLDRRDLVAKEINELLHVSVHTNEFGAYNIDIPKIGPLVVGPEPAKMWVERSKMDDEGKTEGAYDIKSTAAANQKVTHRLKGGKIGGLLEVRDGVLTNVLDRLDTLAFEMSRTVNQIHEQGFTRNGFRGVKFFKDTPNVHRAAEFFDLSDEIKANVNNIATAAERDAPGDNRIAHAISGVQNIKIMNEGRTTMDDWYNSIISEVGILKDKNEHDRSQQKSVVTQLKAMRDQISGVSLDEETANILKYQHTFDASAKIISVANEMLDTVLALGNT